VGDVVGHDVEAAASMGQLRSVVRAYAFDRPSPAPVLQRVDQLFAGMRIPRAASLVMTTLTRVGDGWDVEYSRAGHLPPMLVRPTGVEPLTGALGMLVGFGGAARTASRERLHPGDVLVYYTDGLIERRDRSLQDGMDALAAACRAVGATDAAGIGEELLARLGDAPEDDLALVVVRVPDVGADRPVPDEEERRQRRWLLPNEAASIGRARHAVLRTCHAWGLPDAPAAELVVSELVANAVLHGWGDVALRLSDTGDGLRIEVEEANPAPPVPTEGHEGRVGGYGMQIVERLADWGWHPSGVGKLVWAQVRPTGTRD
jgi:anti-sigma regulatory factor (Ser/Thr protein kinase)